MERKAACAFKPNGLYLAWTGYCPASFSALPTKALRRTGPGGAAVVGFSPGGAAVLHPLTERPFPRRHGRQHTIMPSRVNYQANIWALKEEGCTHVVVTTACGSLREEIQPGDIVVIDQFIDR